MEDTNILSLDTKNMSKRELRMLIIEQLKNLGECDTLMEQEYKNDLTLIDPLIVEAYEKLDHKALMATKLSTKALTEAIIMTDYKERQRGKEVIELIKNSFPVNHFYKANFIKNEIKRIFSLFKIIPAQAITSHTINNYFYCKEQNNSNGRGYYLYESKF